MLWQFPTITLIFDLPHNWLYYYYEYLYFWWCQATTVKGSLRSLQVPCFACQEPLVWISLWALLLSPIFLWNLFFPNTVFFNYLGMPYIAHHSHSLTIPSRLTQNRKRAPSSTCIGHIPIGTWSNSQWPDPFSHLY